MYTVVFLYLVMTHHVLVDQLTSRTDSIRHEDYNNIKCNGLANLHDI